MTGCLSPFVKTNHFYYSNTGNIVEVDNDNDVVENENLDD